MKERIITGFIGGTIFIALLYIGGLPFSIFITILSLIGVYEIHKISNNHKDITLLISLVGVFLLFSTILLEQNFLKLETTILALSLFYIISILLSKKFNIEKNSYLFLSFLYISFGFLQFAQAREEKGFLFILFVLLLIWTTDSGAYFIGKKFGKNKLFERISPKKTIEGSVGGVLSAILVSFIFYLTTTLFSNISEAIFLAILISIVGQLGDLIESAIKRHFQVKDSGQLLPGHGGVFDRFDSLILVFIVLYIVQVI